MENKRKIALSGVLTLALIAVFTASSVPAYDHDKTYNAPPNVTYFVEETASGYCNHSVIIQVRVNTTFPVRSATADISFDPNCVNITDADFTNSAWTGMTGFAWHSNWVRVNGVNWNPPYPSGDNLICNITVRCNESDTCNCTSALNFTYVQLLNASNVPQPVAPHNGTINCSPAPVPDLNVSEINLNPGDTRFSEIERLYVNESNIISAVVWNNGTGAAGPFDVCFDADGVNIGCVPIAGLAAGANTTVSIQWTPTCADYSVMPGFPPQSLPITINVSADCNCTAGCCPNCSTDGSCGKIDELDETNNTLSKFIPAIQPYSTYNVIGGVVNNGYKSKNFDCNITEEPLNLFKHFDLVGGGIVYNVSGNKIYSFDPQETSTRIHQINLPAGATVKDARLYVYWYDKWGNYKTYPGGCLANLSVNFSGTELMPEAVYQDSKGFGNYQSPKGSSVFNVTSLVSASGSYTAIVKNIEPAGGNSTTLLGEMLAVVYEGAAHGDMIELWMLEGMDYLMAADDTHGTHDFSVSPDEATATVTIPGSIDLPVVDTANLITVVAQGMDPGSNLLFNGNVIKTDAWDSPTEISGKINIENVSVENYLKASGNNVGFQDNGTGGMQAANAFLVVKKVPIKIGVEPKDTIVQPQDQFDINIAIDTGNTPVFGVEYYLHYNTSVVRAETQNKGPFLGNYSETWVVINDIDQANGIVSYAETRKGDTGKAGNGTLSTIQFTAIGERGAMSYLNLTGVIIVLEDKNVSAYNVINGTVTINNNRPPVPIPTSKHRVNNVAKKYPCITKLCACKSYDPDEGKGGNISYVRWDFGDGQYGTSEGEFIENCTGAECEGCQKDHKYESWKWEPFGDPEGHYVPFNATLTLTDDGCPEETNSSFLDVTVYIAGDANGDGRVNILDAVYVGRYWGERCDDPGYPEPGRCCYYWTDDRVQQDKADLNNDCVINILDAVIIGANWGHVAW